MNRVATLLLHYLLPVVAVIVVALGYSQYVHAQSSQQLYLCKFKYALCTSARCVPKPNDPNTAICYCNLENGASMSSVPCNTLVPRLKNNSLTVFSTFSLVQFQQGLKSMVCPSGNPWTNCLNKICTVDPHNPFKVTCLCSVNRTGQFTTAGGNCDTSTCPTGYWSGATLPAYFGGLQFLQNALHLKESPAKFCPNAL